MPRPLVAALVCGSPHRNHDFDFARLRLAHALYDAHGIRTEEPLLQGIGDFEVPDELYCLEDVTKDLDVLLHTRWGGEAFGGIQFEEADRPMLYRRAVGDGGVLYLVLGHANRPYDKSFPHVPDPPDYRGPWDLPVFQELVKRGVEWAVQRRPF